MQQLRKARAMLKAARAIRDFAARCTSRMAQRVADAEAELARASV